MARPNRAAELRREWERSQITADRRVSDILAHELGSFDPELTLEDRQRLRRLADSRTTAFYDQVIVESPEYRSAWSAMLRGTDPNSLPALRAGEYRDLAEGSSAAGGYAIPPAFWASLTQALRANDVIRNLALNVTTPDGRTLRKPVVDDTTNPATFFPPASENTQVGVTDPSFTAIALHAYVFAAIERVPNTLLQDEDGQMTVVHSPSDGPNGGKGGSIVEVGDRLDVERMLTEMFGYRIARAQAPYFATGTGTNQPQGIVNCTTGATTAANNALAFSDLRAAWLSLEPAYRASATWVMATATADLIRAMVDGSNKLVFDPTKELTIFGRPVVETPNGDMPAFAAGASNVIVVGDFARGYVVRDTPPVTQILAERYADFFQTGVLSVLRTDAMINDGRALRGLSVHA